MAPAPLRGAILVRLSYLAVGAIGLAFYTYRELLAHRFLSLHDYQVSLVREVEPGLAETR